MLLNDLSGCTIERWNLNRVDNNIKLTIIKEGAHTATKYFNTFVIFESNGIF